MEMTYIYFLENIDQFIGKHAIFTSRLKATGEINKGCAKKIWDNKSFMPLRKDSLIEILKVEVI
jgi:hypothetical protein